MEYERGRKAGAASRVGAAATFTGRVLQDALLDDGERGEIRVFSVIFEPGARTHWHSHAAGQTLVVVTHDSRIAATADRMISMRDGTFIDETRLTGENPRRPRGHG